MGRVKIARKSTFIDMTAMSDVTVLLLTFFMLTSTFLQKEPTTVVTPPSVSTEKVQETNFVQVLVSPEGKVWLTMNNDTSSAWSNEKMRMAESNKLKTGIFSGSFNPVHIGHLALANYLCEYEELDEVWFMVSPQNPLKAGTELWPDDLRLRLVELATEEYPRFRSSDFEFHLPRPSYSVHTLEKLHETYPERDFYLIIGSDNWARFDRWYQSERIIKENRILIYPRPGFPVNENGLPETVRLVHSPTFEISSTFIRQALDEKKDVRYFLHPKVWEYIREYIRQSITDN